MKIKIIFFSCFIAVLLSTCTYDVYNPDICFQEKILPIFVSKCSMSGCHNSNDRRAGYDFTNYDGIMKGIKAGHPLESEIYNVIRGNNPSMPVGQKLDAQDISNIKIWIRMGAKNTSNCSGCDTTDYTYNGSVKPLMANWCVGCHNSNSAGGGYDLSTYSGVVSPITDGRLIGALNHENGFSAMPKNSNKLNGCNIRIIEKWINAGYPNN
jgi:hypothetical protein